MGASIPRASGAKNLWDRSDRIVPSLQQHAESQFLCHLHICVHLFMSYLAALEKNEFKTRTAISHSTADFGSQRFSNIMLPRLLR